MNLFKTFPKTWMLGCAVLALSSCTAPPTALQSPPSSQPAPSVSPGLPNGSAQPPSPPVPSTALATTRVSLYQPDSQCLALVPKSVPVAANAPVKSAIGQIISELNSPEFQVADYSVTVKNREATVDLQLAPSSKRQLDSLSACEQMALFEGIQTTLTSNSQWQIQSVQFTEKGRSVVF